MKTSELRSKALRMIGEGACPADVAAACLVSITTVRKWCILAGVRFKRQKRGARKGTRTPVGIRKAAAAAIAAGATLEEAAGRFDRSPSAISAYCREFGVSRARPGRPKGVPAHNRRWEWENADWEKTDIELAKEFHVSRQRVDQKRREYLAACADPTPSPGA